MCDIFQMDFIVSFPYGSMYLWKYGNLKIFNYALDLREFQELS